MSMFILFCFFSAFKANVIYAGEAIGTVTVLQKAKITGKWETAHSNEGVVVYITGFDEKTPQPGKTHELVQENKSFSPRVLAVTAGDSVSFPNKDNVYHNVWSLSKSKSFDLGTYKAPDNKNLIFETPGLVKVFCNLHPQMISSILVLKNSKYAVTPKSGEFSIKNIPPGKMQVRVWAEGIEPIVRDLEVTKTSVARLDFEVKLTEVSSEHLNKNGKPYLKY